MKKFILLTLLLTSCATSWNQTDKALLGSYITLSAIDTVQTAQIDGEKTVETNPVFAKSDGTANMPLLIGAKVAATGLLYYVADKIPENRTSILVIANGIQGSVVLWNAQF